MGSSPTKRAMLSLGKHGRLAQSVRASALHAEGQWFKPSTAHFYPTVLSQIFRFPLSSVGQSVPITSGRSVVQTLYRPLLSCSAFSILQMNPQLSKLERPDYIGKVSGSNPLPPIFILRCFLSSSDIPLAQWLERPDYIGKVFLTLICFSLLAPIRVNFLCI